LSYFHKISIFIAAMPNSAIFTEPQKSISSNLPNFSYLRVSSFERYQQLKIVNRELNLLMQDVEETILDENRTKEQFTLKGRCFVCDSFSFFKVKRASNPQKANPDNLKVPNWREGLRCEGCGLNNRKRGALHIFDRECSPNPESKIYLTEQKSSLYRHVAQKFNSVFGSEYLGTQIPYGTIAENGVRNESLTCLSFEANKFDHIISLDVLEHIPDYLQALRECYRVLKPKGKLVLSVPFCLNSFDNIIRATVDDLGNITHLKTPQYHGDPMSADGVLCFQDFGWQILDQMREIGFSSVEAIIYRSRFYGYLGSNHIIFVGQK